MAQKILVVEDEFLSRDSIVKFLSMAGYIVREASNGAEALEKLTAERFDIVVTDFVMPHIDGLRLIELVHSKWPELPVILVTGYLSANTGHIILEGRAAEVITKA
jgi:CheY-like chemotaxis protein